MVWARYRPHIPSARGGPTGGAHVRETDMEHRKRVPVQPLSIFLLKEEARTPTQILTSPGDLKRASVGVGRRKIGDLYVRQTPAVPPRWLKFFGDSLSGAMPKLFNASNGAALVVEAGGRTFALCFG